MSCKLFAFSLVFTALAVISAAPVHADPAAGKIKAEAACQTCHGMDGVATVPMAANLSGQQKLYMIAQLQAYRAGQRQHEQMSIIAQMLSDEDIENVSEWYANIKITVETPE